MKKFYRPLLLALLLGLSVSCSTEEVEPDKVLSQTAISNATAT